MRPFLPLILSALCLAGCNGEEQKAPRAAPLVTAGPIAKATFTDTVEAVGTALANEQVVLSAPVTERIESVNFADGGFVKRGQVIATMAVAQEKAELAAAQAQAQQASQQLQRIQALKARGFATAASLDQQLALANAAKAQCAGCVISNQDDDACLEIVKWTDRWRGKETGFRYRNPRIWAGFVASTAALGVRRSHG
mgnify:CR=1 FL=1